MNLRYKIKDIPEEGMLVDLALDRELLSDALQGMGIEFDLDRTAGAVHLELSRSGDEVLVRGSVNATLGLPCGACLQPTRADVQVPVKLVYVLDEDESDESTDDDVLDD